MSKRLTISIGGREALPIRAIPYASLWEFSPDLAARELAHCEAAPFAKLRGLTAHHLSDGVPVAVLAGEWGAVVAALAGLEATLKEKHANDHIGYAAWRKASTSEIPAGVFVWLDDFKQALDRIGCKYTLTPMLDEATRATVLEGFEQFAPPSASLAQQAQAPSGPSISILEAMEWLTIPDAAAYLTAKLSEKIRDADLLRLGLARKIRLSVRLLNPVDVRNTKVFPANHQFRSHQEMKEMSRYEAGLCISGESDVFGGDVAVTKDVATLRLLPGKSNVFDLKMSQGAARFIEKLLQEKTGGPTVENEFYGGCFIESETGKLFQVQTALPDKPPSEEKGYYDPDRFVPANFLPDSLPLVIRTAALREFLEARSTKQGAAAPAMSGAKADTGDCRLTDEEEARLDACLDGGFSEPVSISWEYWIARFPSLTAKAASRLMVGLEPHKFEDLTPYYQAQDSIAARADRARKIEELAIFEGMTEATARDWLAWARQRKFNLHPMFAVAVDEWQPMQPELVALAQTVSATPETPEAESKGAKKRETQADRVESWLVECEKRASEKNLAFDRKNMPGQKAQFLDLLRRLEPSFKDMAGVASLDRYLKGRCKWSNSAAANPDATPLYAQLFPEAYKQRPGAVSDIATQRRKS